MLSRNKLAAIISNCGCVLVVLAFAITTPSPVAAQSQGYSNWQPIYGPNVCAITDAYQTWVTNDLAGNAPSPSSFSANYMATHISENSHGAIFDEDVYQIVFQPTSGNSTTFNIPTSSCLNSAFPAISPVVSVSSTGTLTGEYVRAIAAANALHSKSQPKTFTADSNFAYTTSPGSVVSVSTVASTGKIAVGFAQNFKRLGGPFLGGCYKEQQFFVDPSSFAASATTIGCLK